MLPLLLGQVAQELSSTGVACACGRCFVKPTRLHLHHFGALPRFLWREWSIRPDGLATDEPADVIPAQVRHVIAKALAVQVEQPVPVSILVGPQPAELVGRLRMGLLQARGKVVVDAGIFLFEGNGERQHLAFGEAVEASGHGASASVESIRCWDVLPVGPQSRETSVNTLLSASDYAYRH